MVLNIFTIFPPFTPKTALDIGQKGHFFKKKASKISHPPTPFLSVLHQNEALHNFCKRVQHSIVEHNIGLEYALPFHLIKFVKYAHFLSKYGIC